MFNLISKIALLIAISHGVVLAADKDVDGAHVYRAHTHGNGTLELAIDGNSVKGKFEIPMESLLGFENLPKNADQKRAVSTLQDASKKIDNFIKLPSQAGCVQKRTVAEADMFLGKKSDHSDLDLTFEFECKKPTEINQINLVIFTNYQKLKSLKVDVLSQISQHSFQVSSKKPFVNF